MFNPIKVDRVLDGVGKVYSFANGYGASVVKHSGSYGGPEGLWELAIIRFDSTGEWKIDYETGLSFDVEGWLDDDAVEDWLKKISDLVI